MVVKCLVERVAEVEWMNALRCTAGSIGTSATEAAKTEMRSAREGDLGTNKTEGSRQVDGGAIPGRGRPCPQGVAEGCSVKKNAV